MKCNTVNFSTISSLEWWFNWGEQVVRRCTFFPHPTNSFVANIGIVSKLFSPARFSLARFSPRTRIPLLLRLLCWNILVCSSSRSSCKQKQFLEFSLYKDSIFQISDMMMARKLWKVKNCSICSNIQCMLECLKHLNNTVPAIPSGQRTILGLRRQKVLWAIQWRLDAVFKILGCVPEWGVRKITAQWPTSSVWTSF